MVPVVAAVVAVSSGVVTEQVIKVTPLLGLQDRRSLLVYVVAALPCRDVWQTVVPRDARDVGAVRQEALKALVPSADARPVVVVLRVLVEGREADRPRRGTQRRVVLWQTPKEVA